MSYQADADRSNADVGSPSAELKEQALREQLKEYMDAAGMLAIEKAEQRRRAAALEDALSTVMKMDVNGHQLQDRLQFSTAGREILGKIRAAMNQEAK